MFDLNEDFYQVAQMSGDFPPAFAGSQFVYGAVLFMLISVSSIAMQVFLEELALFYRGGMPRRSSRSIYARLQIILMASFITAVTPDAVFMLVWGEISPVNIALVSLGDRVFDFISGFLFLRWWWLRARTSEIVELQLSPFNTSKREWLTAEQLRNKMVLLSMSMILALGVALAK